MVWKFDKDKITKLSSEIFNAMDKLKELSMMSEKEFLSDPYKIASAKYFLIVSIEAAIDMCNHLISRNRLRVPYDYADTFRVMGEVGVFSEDYVEKLTMMAKFRNRLVHIYWEVDDKAIFDILREDIQNIYDFVDKFTSYLSSHEKQ